MLTLPDYLKRHSLTQEAFAKRTGLSQGAVSRLCARTRGISIQTAALIERVTNGEVPIAVWAADDEKAGAA